MIDIMTVTTLKLEVYLDKAEESRFRLTACNGEIIGVFEGCKAKAGCLNIDSVRCNAPQALIVK